MPFGLFYYLYLPSGAGPGAMSEAQRRAFGGNGFFFLFPPNGAPDQRASFLARLCPGAGYKALIN